MLAITKGAVHDLRSSSNTGLLPSGCFGPSNPGVSTKGSRSMVTRLKSLIVASTMARMLAAVPPESVPLILRTRPFTRAAGAPKAFFASSWAQNTPSSNGSES